MAKKTETQSAEAHDAARKRKRRESKKDEKWTNENKQQQEKNGQRETQKIKTFTSHKCPWREVRNNFLLFVLVFLVFGRSCHCPVPLSLSLSVVRELIWNYAWVGIERASKYESRFSYRQCILVCAPIRNDKTNILSDAHTHPCGPIVAKKSQTENYCYYL